MRQLLKKKMMLMLGAEAMVVAVAAAVVPVIAYCNADCSVDDSSLLVPSGT